jgi:hypothetical protein
MVEPGNMGHFRRELICEAARGGPIPVGDEARTLLKPNHPGLALGFALFVPESLGK